MMRMPMLLLFAFTLPDSQVAQSQTYIAQASFSGNGDWLALIVGRDNALNALVLLDTATCARSVLQMPDFHHYPEPVGQIAWNDTHSSFIVYLRARANTGDVSKYIGSFWAFDVATGAWRALGAARQMRDKEAVPKCCYDSTDDTIRYFEPASAQFVSLKCSLNRESILRLRVVPNHTAYEFFRGGVAALIGSGDQPRLNCDSFNDSIRKYDMSTGKVIWSADIKRVVNVKLSPSATHFAALQREPIRHELAGGALYVIQPRVNTYTRVGDVSLHAGFSWRPDGGVLAYDSGLDGLVVFHMSDLRNEVVAPLPSHVWLPYWHPTTNELWAVREYCVVVRYSAGNWVDVVDIQKKRPKAGAALNE